MKRLAKILAGIVAAIIILIIVAALVLPLVFDPNDYKDEIAGMIEQQIGRDVAIPGEIQLSVFPWLGISIGHVTVANAPGFGERPMAEIASANVHVKLLPLLHKQIQIGTIDIEGLRLRLSRDAKGRTNWHSIVEHLNAPADAAQTQPAQGGDRTAAGAVRGKAGSQAQQSSGDGGFDLTSLEIGSIQVSDAAISWNDAMTGNSYKLFNIHLSTGHLAEDEPFKLDMGATLAAATAGVSSTISLSSTIRPDISAGIYRFSDLDLSIEAEGPAVPGGNQKLELSGHGILNLAAGTFALRELAISAAGIDVSGQILGKDLRETPVFSGHVAVAQFNPRAVLDRLGMALPQLQGDKALTSASLRAQFTATPGSAEISQLRIELDDSTLTGHARVTDFAAPAIAFTANVDHFNLDHYLPVTEKPAPGSSEQKAPDADTAAHADNVTRIDLSLLQSLQLDGELHVGRLTAYDMTFNDATVAVRASDGVLTIKPLASGFYDGKIHVLARVDASGEVPRYTLDASLKNLKFAPLLKDLFGSDLVSALGSLKLDLSSSGATLTAIKHALDGTIAFELRDGALHGFSLAALIAAARNRFLDEGSGQAGAQLGHKTPFDKFTGRFSIDNGTLSGDGMTLDTRYLDIIGSGQYNLVANDLDYTLNVHVDDKNGPLAEVAGLSVPIHLSGNLLSPDYSIDIESALKALARQHLQDEKKELKHKLKKELSEELGGSDGQLSKQLKQGLSELFN